MFFRTKYRPSKTVKENVKLMFENVTYNEKTGEKITWYSTEEGLFSVGKAFYSEKEKRFVPVQENS